MTDRLNASSPEVQKALGAKPKNKYSAKRTVVDGIKFASRKEARRWGELLLLQGAGEIQFIKRQVDFMLHAGRAQKTVGIYRADFVYYEWNGCDWIQVVEDTKGMRTALYKWKRRHMAAEYGIEIRET